MEPPDHRRRRRHAVALAVVGLVVAVIVVTVVFAGGTSRERRPPLPASRPRTASAPASVTQPAAPAASATAPQPAPPPKGEQFGVNVNRLFNGGAYTPAQIEAQLREVAATGTTVARSDAAWEAAEPQPPVRGVHSYDWSFDDQIAGSLAKQGIQWLALLDYSTPWAQSVPGQDHSPPRQPSDFAAFAAALAQRYGAGGSFWRTRPDLRVPPVDTFEVWNEPDNPSFWKPAPDAARYADLYLAARAAIRAVDPSARVIVGGLSDPTTFLPALLGTRPDLAGDLDGVAIHPYGPDPRAVLSRVHDARAALVRLGLADVPLYVTEFGWTTDPQRALNYAPEDRRRGYIETTLAALGHTDCGIAATFLYTWATPRRDPSNPQDWYGLGSTDDVQAFARGLRRAGGAGGRNSLCG